jgi:hypothetical protein
MPWLGRTLLGYLRGLCLGQTTGFVPICQGRHGLRTQEQVLRLIGRETKIGKYIPAASGHLEFAHYDLILSRLLPSQINGFGCAFDMENFILVSI